MNGEGRIRYLGVTEMRDLERVETFVRAGGGPFPDEVRRKELVELLEP